MPLNNKALKEAGFNLDRGQGKSKDSGRSALREAGFSIGETEAQETEAQETETFTSEDQGFFRQGVNTPYGVGQTPRGMSETMREELGAADLETAKGSAVETWSPPEMIASIYSGGAYAAWRIGGQTALRALGTGAKEAIAGTMSEIPISLFGETLREKYGWGAALITELSGGLAAGFTADHFIVNKLDDIGRFIGKSTNLKNLRRYSEEAQEEVMDTLDKLLRVSSDRGDIVEPATPEVTESEVLDLNTLMDVPQLKIKEKRPSFPRAGRQEISEEAARAQRTQAQRRAKQLETFDQARRMERGEGPTGIPEDEMPEPARTMARRAREAAAKKRQEIWDEQQLKAELEKYEDEEAALSRINELRRENQLETYSKSDLENARIGSKSESEAEAKIGYRGKFQGKDISKDQADVIIKDMEADETHTEEVSKEFWNEVYPNLNEEGRANVHRRLYQISGLEPGATVKSRSGERIKSKSWADIAEDTERDLPSNPGELEDAERKYIALLEYANRNAPKKTKDVTPDASRVTEEEGISTETTIFKKDGNTYTSEKSAQSALKRKGLQNTYRVVEHGDGYALRGPSEQAGFAKKAEPGRPSEPAKKVDLEERESLIRQIAQKRGATQISREDEFKADFTQIADEYQPKEQAEVPARKGRSKQEENSAQIQKDIEEFFEPYTDRDVDDEIPLSQFENGQVKDEYEMDVGFEDDIAYRDEDFISLQDLEAEEDSLRTFDDFLQDLHTVFGKKIGLTIDDISKTATRDQVEAYKNLLKDLKRHRQKAVRAGLDLADYFKQMGFSDPIAQRLKAQTEILTQKEPQQAIEETAEAAEKVSDTSRKAGPGEVLDTNKIFGSLRAKFSTEWPFRKIGAPEAGFAFKNYYSVMDMFEEEGRHAILRLTRKFGIDPEDMADVALKREDPNYDMNNPAQRVALSQTKQARVNNAVDFVNDYFEKSLKDHQNTGVFQKPWPDVFIEKQQSKIARMQEQLKSETKPAKRVKLDAEIATAQERIDAVKGTRYTPIIKSWLEDLEKSDPKTFGKVVQFLNRKDRKTPTLRGLLDAGLITREQADIRDLIAHYARRKAKDIANKKLLDGLEADGLAKRWRFRDENGKVIKEIEPEEAKNFNWTPPNTRKLPIFKDHVLEPRTRDYLEDFYESIGKRNKFERFMSTVKMAQFFNPTIMPMYDTYQTFMLHGLDSLKIPGHIKDGIKSALNKDAEFLEASEMGLFSKPFSNPLGSWQESIRKAKLPMKKRMLDLMNPMPHTAIKNYYNMAWDSAWFMDQAIRMASYKELKKRGFSPRDAAQLAALFHGNYAGVPPGTRRVLNQTLFTPTFKIAMGELYTNMAKAAVESGRRAGKAKLPGMKTRALAGGLLGLAAVNHGKDMLMRHVWGFERDTWGRRYTKEVDTNEGPREITITFSDPANLPVQWINKTYEAIFPKPGAESTPIGRFIEGNKYQIHPVLRTVLYDFQENRRLDGGPIYYNSDSDIMKYAKMAGYLTEQFIPVLQVFGLGDEDREERKILNNEFGRIQHNLLRIFAFPYVRKTADQRAKWRIRNINDDIKQYMREHEQMSEERLQRTKEKLDQLRKEIQED